MASARNGNDFSLRDVAAGMEAHLINDLISATFVVDLLGRQPGCPRRHMDVLAFPLRSVRITLLMKRLLPYWV